MVIDTTDTAAVARHAFVRPFRSRVAAARNEIEGDSTRDERGCVCRETR